MAQNHALKPIARALADDEMQLALNRNEPLAYALFMLFRWGSLTEQVCPKCGVVKAHIPRPRHKQWRCRDCGCDFSLKSGSLIDGTKLPYWKVLKALYLWCMEPKGVSAISIARRCNLSYESAYLLLHKFRWAFWNTQQTDRMTGTFEVDVVWVLKGQRKNNDRTKEALKKRNAAKRADVIKELTSRGATQKEAETKAYKLFPPESKALGPNPKKQPILAIVQRHEVEGKRGSKFVVGFPVADESYAEVAPIIKRFIEPGSKLLTDGASAYTGLAALYDLEQINHDEMYSKGNGLHTNFVESCFARWRRMEIGTHHKMNARTLHLFFADCAWREAERETVPVDKFAKALLTVAREGVCRRFKKYGRGMKERETKPRTISLRPIHRAAGAALEGALKVMDQASRFSDSVTKFLKLTKPTPSFAPAGYAQVAEAPLWTLGRRRKPASTGTPAVLPPVTGYKLPPAYTPVYSFNVFGMLAQALRAKRQAP